MACDSANMSWGSYSDILKKYIYVDVYSSNDTGGFILLWVDLNGNKQ